MLDVIIWIITLILLLVYRKNFILTDKPMTSISKLFIILFALVFFGYNLYSTAIIYYKAYNPDYEYEQMLKQVDFHINKPSILPGNRVQDSKFYFSEKEFAGKNNAVKVVYTIPLSNQLKSNGPKPIILTQVKMDAGFNLEQFILHENEKTGPNIKVTPVVLSNWPTQPSFTVYRQLVNSNYAALYALTPDNVLIFMVTMGDTVENLSKMAQSLK